MERRSTAGTTSTAASADRSNSDTAHTRFAALTAGRPKMICANNDPCPYFPTSATSEHLGTFRHHDVGEATQHTLACGVFTPIRIPTGMLLSRLGAYSSESPHPQS